MSGGTIRRMRRVVQYLFVFTQTIKWPLILHQSALPPPVFTTRTGTVIDRSFDNRSARIESVRWLFNRFQNEVFLIASLLWSFALEMHQRQFFQLFPRMFRNDVAFTVKIMCGIKHWYCRCWLKDKTYSRNVKCYWYYIGMCSFLSMLKGSVKYCVQKYLRTCSKWRRRRLRNACLSITDGHEFRTSRVEARKSLRYRSEISERDL